MHMRSRPCSQQEGFEITRTHDSTGAIVVADFIIETGGVDYAASSIYTAGVFFVSAAHKCAIFLFAMQSRFAFDLQST